MIEGPVYISVLVLIKLLDLKLRARTIWRLARAGKTEVRAHFAHESEEGCSYEDDRVFRFVLSSRKNDRLKLDIDAYEHSDNL